MGQYIAANRAVIEGQPIVSTVQKDTQKPTRDGGGAQVIATVWVEHIDFLIAVSVR